MTSQQASIVSSSQHRWTGTGPVNHLLATFYALTLAGFASVSVLPVIWDTPSRPIMATYRVIFALLALVLIVRDGLHRRRFFQSKPWLALCLLWLLLIARLANDLLIHPIYTLVPKDDYLMMVPGITILPSLAMAVVPTQRTLEYALRLAIRFLATACALLLLVSLLYGSNLVAMYMRVGTVVMHPIMVGHIGASLALVSIARLIMRRQRTGLRFVSLATAILGVSVVMVAGSRGPQLALVLPVLALLFMKGSRRNRLTLVFGILILAYPCFVAIDYLEANSSIRPLQRWNEMSDVQDSRSAGRRLQLIGSAWSRFQSHPLTGGGMVEEESGEYVHNIVLDAFFSTGLFGGCLFLLFVIDVTVKALRLLSRTDDGWVGLLYIQMLVGTLISGHIFLDTSFWPWAMVVLALSYGTSARRGIVPLPDGPLTESPGGLLYRVVPVYPSSLRSGGGQSIYDQ